MNYKTGTYKDTTELITALRSFMVTDCSLTERAFATEGTGYKLLVSDANAQYNFRTASAETVCDTQIGNLTGLAMNFATAYDAGENWDTQTNFMRQSNTVPDGYIFPDGTDDYVQTTQSNFSDTVSIAFTYANWIYTFPGKSEFMRSDSVKFRIYADATSPATPPNVLRVKSGKYETRNWKSSNTIPYNDNSWHTIVITIDYTSNTCKIYFDGVEDSGVATTTTQTNEAFTSLQFFNNKYTTGKFKNIIITSDVMDATDIANYHTGTLASLTAIDNKLLWYKCNEASGNLADSSGNANTGTVYNASASFYNPVTNSAAVMATITSGTYYFSSNNEEYAIVLKSSLGIYQQLCFGKIQGTGTNTWIYATGTISGYLANYSTNGKFMLFSDSVDNSGTDYGSLFLYNITTGYHYMDYEIGYKIIAPVADVTGATMNKFQSDLWEKGVNQGCRIPPLLKLYFFLMSGTDYKYIGYSDLIRLINITNTDAEAEFVLGTDRFKAFPLNSMNDTYFYRGIAVKK